MDYSQQCTEFENLSRLKKSIYLLFVVMFTSTGDKEAFYSTMKTKLGSSWNEDVKDLDHFYYLMETKIGYKWDGEGWLKLNF